jgi:hypothetical protein
MVRFRIVAVCAMAAGLLAACGAVDDGPSTSTSDGANGSSTAPETPAECVDPGPIVAVGSAFLDGEPTYVTLTAGTYAARAEGFLHGGVLDPPVGRTSLVWGPASNLPTYSPGSNTVTNATDSFDVVEGSATVRTMPAGRIWLLNSSYPRLSLQACGGAQISEVSASP